MQHVHTCTTRTLTRHIHTQGMQHVHTTETHAIYMHTPIHTTTRAYYIRVYSTRTHRAQEVEANLGYYAISF